MKEPLVSILMTAHNREDYIGEAIESVLASVYSNFELIVVDDCSKDETVEIANDYASRDSRIRVYLNSENLGDYRNRNKAASYAMGKYIKYLDSDDLIMPWGLHVMVYSMEKHPTAAFAVCANKALNAIFPVLIEPVDIFRRYYYKNELLATGPTGTIIRTDFFREAGGFSGENFIGDIQFWLKLSAKNPIVLMPPGLVYWREHEGQQIVEEKKNELIELRRFQLDKETLQHEDCPLLKEESLTIIRNLTNIKTRKIAIEILKGNFVRGIRKLKLFEIGFRDVLSALKKNKAQ